MQIQHWPHTPDMLGPVATRQLTGSGRRRSIEQRDKQHKQQDRSLPAKCTSNTSASCSHRTRWLVYGKPQPQTRSIIGKRARRTLSKFNLLLSTRSRLMSRPSHTVGQPLITPVTPYIDGFYDDEEQQEEEAVCDPVPRRLSERCPILDYLLNLTDRLTTILMRRVALISAF